MLQKEEQEHGQDAVEVDMCLQKSSVRTHWGHGGKRGKKKGFKEDFSWINPKESPFWCHVGDHALAIQCRNLWTRDHSLSRVSAAPPLNCRRNTPPFSVLIWPSTCQYFSRKWVVYTLTWRLLWFYLVRDSIDKLKLTHDIISLLLQDVHSTTFALSLIFSFSTLKMTHSVLQLGTFCLKSVFQFYFLDPRRHKNHRTTSQ